jgi:hypothetical protein
MIHDSLGLQVNPKQLDFDDALDETNPGGHGTSDSLQQRSLVETSDKMCEFQQIFHNPILSISFMILTFYSLRDHSCS